MTDLHVGAELVQEAHGYEYRYRVVDSRAHVRQDGVRTTIYRLLGRCATCGAEFATSATPGTRWITRTCREHRNQVLALAAKRSIAARARRGKQHDAATSTAIYKGRKMSGSDRRSPQSDQSDQKEGRHADPPATRAGTTPSV